MRAGKAAVFRTKSLRHVRGRSSSVCGSQHTFFFTGKGLTTAYGGDVLIRFLPFRFLFDLTDFVSRAVKID